jgi:hypothetical protein
MSRSPGTRRSRERKPFATAIALGGVLITNGTPSEAATATRMAVDGDGSTVAANGISKVAVAVVFCRKTADDGVKQGYTGCFSRSARARSMIAPSPRSPAMAATMGPNTGMIPTTNSRNPPTRKFRRAP